MQRLKELREEKELSQVKLAQRADMNPATVYRIETGKRSPTVQQLERLAEALEVEVDEFFPKAQAPLPLEPSAEEQRGPDAERLGDRKHFLIRALSNAAMRGEELEETWKNNQEDRESRWDYWMTYEAAVAWFLVRDWGEELGDDPDVCKAYEHLSAVESRIEALVTQWWRARPEGRREMARFAEIRRGRAVEPQHTSTEKSELA